MTVSLHRTIRGSAVLVLALLAACGDPPPRPPIAGPEARAEVDAATAAYGACIENGARSVPLSDRTPGVVLDDVVKGCAPARAALAEKIAAFHAIGHPNQTPAQLAAVADASIQQIEPDLTARGVVAYVGRTSPTLEAQ